MAGAIIGTGSWSRSKAPVVSFGYHLDRFLDYWGFKLECIVQLDAVWRNSLTMSGFVEEMITYGMSMMEAEWFWGVISNVDGSHGQREWKLIRQSAT